MNFVSTVKLKLLLLLFISAPITACSQKECHGLSQDVNWRTTKEQYIDDINQFVDSIVNLHPQPFEFISNNEFLKVIDSCKNEITDDLCPAEFYVICCKIAASVGCVHTRVSSEGVLEVSKELFFPIKAQYFNEDLVVMKEIETKTAIPVGSKILSINGVPAIKLKENLMQAISADGRNRSYIESVINTSFAYYCALFFDLPTKYSVEIDSFGEVEMIELKSGIDSQNKSNLVEHLALEIDKENKTAVLKIGSFIYYDNDFLEFKTFVDEAFDKIRNEEVEHLILDLRGNGGGDPYCASYLLQYLSDTTFRYYKSGSTVWYKELEQEILPHSNRFKGAQYYLINSLCNSTTGHFCSLLKHYNLGTFVGSETGATYSCNANTTEFKLLNSRIRCFVATSTYETDVVGFEKGKGIIPEYPIHRDFEDYFSNEDPELVKAKELIKAFNN